MICEMLSELQPLVSSGVCALREESSETNVILQYTLLASILSAVCNSTVIVCIAHLLHII